jgi:hypothetical protein
MTTYNDDYEISWWIYLILISCGALMIYLSYFANFFEITIHEYNGLLSLDIDLAFKYWFFFIKWIITPLAGLLAFISTPLMFIALFDKNKSKDTNA